MNYELRIISYLCTKFNGFMKKIASYAGLLLIILGTIGLVLTRIPAVGSHNSILTLSLAAIIGGIWLHILSIKREGKYSKGS